MLYSINPTKTFTAGVSYTITRDHEVYRLPVVPIKPVMSMATYSAVEVSAHIPLKKITLHGRLNDITSLNATLPKLTVSGDLYAPGVASTKITLPKAVVSGSFAASPGDYSLSVALRKAILSGSITPEAVSSLDVSLRKLVISGKVTAPVGYTVNPSIRKLAVSGAMSVRAGYAAEIFLPRFTLLSRMSGEALKSVVETWVVNLNTQGHWMYDGFEFNSITRFQDEYYLASSAGLFKLQTPSVSTVVGQVITPTLTPADQNASYVHDVYLHCRGDNDLTMNSIVDEDRSIGYDVTARPNKLGRHVQRVKLAKGVKGTDWAFDLRGKLDLSAIEIRFLRSKRSR